ncbi:MAG: hypothetical protein QM538_05135 [Methylacidiphilales bacterium]|nr:hypothetical protein [Candidatus Methylacidiphilales bacterium]
MNCIVFILFILVNLITNANGENTYVNKHISGNLVISGIAGLSGVKTTSNQLYSISANFRWQDFELLPHFGIAIEIDALHTSINYKFIGIMSCGVYWKPQFNFLPRYNYLAFRPYIYHYGNTKTIQPSEIIQRCIDIQASKEHFNYEITIPIKNKYTQLLVSEAYINYETDLLRFRVGRQKLNWGQFDISPISYLLPLQLTGSVHQANKNNILYPILSATLSIYPDPEWQIELHYFFNHDRDPLGYKYFNSAFVDVSRLEKSAFPRLDNALTANDWGRPGYTFIPQFAQYRLIDTSDDQQAIRILYSNPAVTLGLTFFNGYWGQLHGVEGKHRRAVQVLDVAPPTYQNPIRSEYVDPSRFTPLYSTFTDFGSGFAKIKAVAFELSVPDDRYTFKFDYLKVLNAIPDSRTALNSIIATDQPHYLAIPTCADIRQALYADFTLIDGKYLQGCTSDLEQVYFNYILIKNKGKLDILVDYELASLGFDYQGEEWNTTFQVFIYKKKYRNINFIKFYEIYDLFNRKILKSKTELYYLPLIATQYIFGHERSESVGFIWKITEELDKEIALGLYYTNKSIDNVEFTVTLSVISAELGFSGVYLPSLPQIENKLKQYGHKTDGPESLYSAEYSNESHPIGRTGSLTFSVKYYY